MIVMFRILIMKTIRKGQSWGGFVVLLASSDVDKAMVRAGSSAGEVESTPPPDLQAQPARY